MIDYRKGWEAGSVGWMAALPHVETDCSCQI